MNRLPAPMGLLIDRQGRVQSVIVGDASSIMIADVARARQSAGRLRGLRLLHAHLPGTFAQATDILLRRDVAHITLLGDVDENGTLDSTDIFYAMYYVASIAVGNAGELTPQQITAADIDCDGAVDASDIFYLMYYVALHGAGIRQTWSELLEK